jgi:hypothetical protein
MACLYKRKKQGGVMEEIIAYCGLLCHECGAYLATLANDDKKRALVAEQWKKEYKHDFKPEDINCTGCTSEGENLFSYCHVCEIRKCAKEKDVLTCAHCYDYPCEKLDKFFQMAPDSKTRLDEIREKFRG